MMRDLGDRVGTVVSRMAHIECPRTRSAVVVFEDLLDEHTDVGGLAMNIERLSSEIDDRMIGQRAQLEQFAIDLRRVDLSARAQVFLDAYSRRRRTATP